MKKFLIFIGIWVAFATTAFIATTAFMQDNSTLEQLIKNTESEASSDRVLGFQALASYWDRGQPGVAGFSDTPPESTAPKTQKPPITDVSLNKIAKAIERGVNDSDSDVRKAAAIALINAPRSSDAVQSAVLAGIKSDDSTVNWYLVSSHSLCSSLTKCLTSGSRSTSKSRYGDLLAATTPGFTNRS